ncbi:MAG: potassium channel family protein [Candidatus Nanopelagicales bacterium]|nr:potassium channel family protein [Candidatus Nanopelagicales bacterium]
MKTEPPLAAGKTKAEAMRCLKRRISDALYRQLVNDARVAATAFSEPLDRVGALYFTVTVLATVGFGDIHPVSSLARAAVTGQMVMDVVLVGVVVRVLVAAARISLQAAPEKPGVASGD